MSIVVIPAIDILDGRCVRLLRGDYEHPTVYSDDPAEIANGFAEQGAQRIHVVDLDAARGAGDNRAVIEKMVRRHGVKVQIAGGVRTAEAVDAWVAAGAYAVVMGTTAVRSPRLLERCANNHPGRVLAALDVRDDQPAVTGWTQTEPMLIGALVGRWDQLPLAGVIVTSVDSDGTLGGPDLKTLTKVRSMTDLAIQYSGGVSSVEDIKSVIAAGAESVILGKALYEGKLTISQILDL